jgi:hypothetical protein
LPACGGADRAGPQPDRDQTHFRFVAETYYCYVTSSTAKCIELASTKQARRHRPPNSWDIRDNYRSAVFHGALPGQDQRELRRGKSSHLTTNRAKIPSLLQQVTGVARAKNAHSPDSHVFDGTHEKKFEGEGVMLFQIEFLRRTEEAPDGEVIRRNSGQFASEKDVEDDVEVGGRMGQTQAMTTASPS